MSVQSDSIKHHFGISVVLLSNYLRKFTIRNHDHDLPFDHFFNNPTSPPPHKNGFLKGTQKKTNNTEAILYHNLPFTTFGTNFRSMGSKKKDSKKIFFKQFFLLLHQPMSCTYARCTGSQITQWKVENEHASYCSLDSFKKAEDYLREFYKQSNR